MFLQVKQHAHRVPLLKEVVLSPEGIEERASRGKFLGRPARQTPGAVSNGTRLDADHTM